MNFRIPVEEEVSPAEIKEVLQNGDRKSKKKEMSGWASGCMTLVACGNLNVGKKTCR